MESEIQDVLEALREAAKLIKVLDLKVAKLNASLFVVRNVLVEKLSPEARKELAVQEENAQHAAAEPHLPR